MRIATPALALAFVLGMMGCLGDKRDASNLAMTAKSPDFAVAIFYPMADSNGLETLYPIESAKLSNAGQMVLVAKVDRINGFAGDLDLSVSGLPPGVTGTFDVPKLVGLQTTAHLTISATASVPTAATVATIAANFGSSVKRTAQISLSGVSPYFSVVARPSQPQINGANANSSGAVRLVRGGTSQNVIGTVGGYGGFEGILNYAVVGRDANLGVALSSQTGAITKTEAVTNVNFSVTAMPELAEGDQRPVFSVTSGGVTKQSPVHLIVSDMGFSTQIQSGFRMTPGSTARIHVPVRRLPGTYVSPGMTTLNVPSGMTVTPSIAWGSLDGIVEVVLAPTIAPGDYAFTLNVLVAGDAVALQVPVKVVDPATVPADVRVARILVGQSFLKEGTRLVSGRDAFAMAHVLADRADVSATTVTMTAVGVAGAQPIIMKGPAKFPVSEDDTSVATAFTAVIPKEWVVNGVPLQVDVAPLAGEDITDNAKKVILDVGPAVTLPLTLVPVTIGTKTGVLPSSADVNSYLTSVWPIAGARVRTRAPFLFTGTLQPDGTGWDVLMSQLDGLHTVDGSNDIYYGLLSLGYDSGVAGMAYVAGSTGAGWDRRQAGPLGVGALDSVDVMAHELGHIMGRFHSPCSANGTDVTYPYLNGAVGVPGLDMRAIALGHPELAILPPTETDIMGYCDNRWVSDFTYEHAQDYVEAAKSFYDDCITAEPTAIVAQAPAMMTFVSGSISETDGTMVVNPIYKVGVHADLTNIGEDEITIETDRGTFTGKASVKHLSNPIGGKEITHFSALLPEADVVTSVSIKRHGEKVLRFDMPKSNEKVAIPSATAPAVGVTIVKDGSDMVVTWDATRMPYLMLSRHQDGKRTTLCISATGGQIRVPASIESAGSWFEASLSNGGRTEVVRIRP
jgi:hypothetical protein